MEDIKEIELNEEQELELDTCEILEESGDIKLSSFENAIVIPMDLSVEMIMNWYNSKKVELEPNFQRRIVWDKMRISLFIESLILNVPIPSILLASDEEKNKFLVIDGKQRLNAIISFISPENDGHGTKLTGLNVLKELNGLNYAQLKKDITKEKYLSKLENAIIKANVLKKHDVNLLYFVFSRLNSGSVPLSTQELRQSLYPGKFINFINDYSCKSEGIKKILNLKNPDKRMRDAELLVRYYSFKYFYKEYNGSINDFFNDTCKKLNNQWQINSESIQRDANELEEAIRFIYQYFQEDSFRVYFVDENGEHFGPFNRPMFDLMVSIFSDKKARDFVNNNSINLKEFTINLFKTNKVFADAFLPTTHSKEKTFARYDEFVKELKLEL